MWGPDCIFIFHGGTVNWGTLEHVQIFDHFHIDENQRDEDEILLDPVQELYFLCIRNAQGEEIHYLARGKPLMIPLPNSMTQLSLSSLPPHSTEFSMSCGSSSLLMTNLLIVRYSLQ